MKTTCHIKLKFFLQTKLLENLLLPKYLISVTAFNVTVFKHYKAKVASYLIFMYLFLVEQISWSKAVYPLPSTRKDENDPGCIGFHVCRVYDHLKDTSCHNKVINKHATMMYIYKIDLMIWCQLILFGIDKAFLFFQGLPFKVWTHWPS